MTSVLCCVVLCCVVLCCVVLCCVVLCCVVLCCVVVCCVVVWCVVLCCVAPFDQHHDIIVPSLSLHTAEAFFFEATIYQSRRYHIDYVADFPTRTIIFCCFLLCICGFHCGHTRDKETVSLMFLFFIMSGFNYNLALYNMLFVELDGIKMLELNCHYVILIVFRPSVLMSAYYRISVYYIH